jgi:hypothetical protein
MLVKRVVEARARFAVWAWRLATREGRGADKERTVDKDTYREVRLVSHKKMLAILFPLGAGVHKMILESPNACLRFSFAGVFANNCERK